MTGLNNGMNWLTDWYQSNCDGEWEHDEGITIVTIDNPGWHISISLTGTALEKENFDEVSHDGEDDNDWYSARISNANETRELGGRCFMAFCGPKNVNDIIAVFKEFAERKRGTDAVA